MILADENIFKGLISALRENGCQVFSVVELSRGISDFGTSKLSAELPGIRLTND